MKMTQRSWGRVGAGLFLSVSMVALAHGWPSDQADAPTPMQAVPTCLGLPATIVGGPGNDVLTGGAGPDVIVGLGGADEIFGGGGADVICGGSENDVLHGEGGDDRIQGGPGDDTFLGGAGADTADYSEAPAGVTIRINNFGGTSVDGLGGSDSMDNMEHADGSLFDDEIHGDDFANRIEAKAGDDLLFGHQGADTLIGGPDTDEAHGGNGVDGCTAETVFSCP